MYTSIVKYGTKTNPQAGDAVVSSGNLTAGRYRIVVVTKPSGTVAAGDADNVQLLNTTGGTVSVLMTSKTADSPTTSPDIWLDFHTAGTVSVVAVANGSGTAAVYGAMMVLTPEALYP